MHQDGCGNLSQNAQVGDCNRVFAKRGMGDDQHAQCEREVQERVELKAEEGAGKDTQKPEERSMEKGRKQRLAVRISA